MPQECRGPVVCLFLGGENGMFSHIMIGSNDIARSKKFYDALFTAIGGEPGSEVREGRLAYTHNGSRFMVTKPNDGKTCDERQRRHDRLSDERCGAGRGVAQSRRRKWRHVDRGPAWRPSEWRLSRLFA